jgi:hypothetical protein
LAGGSRTLLLILMRDGSFVKHQLLKRGHLMSTAPAFHGQNTGPVSENSEFFVNRIVLDAPAAWSRKQMLGAAVRRGKNLIL